MKEKEIYEKFREYGTDKNGILKDYLYIKIKNGIEFIEYCEKKKVVIFGLEAFKEVKNGLQIFDYGNYSEEIEIKEWELYVKKSCKKAKEKINKIKEENEKEVEKIYIDFSISLLESYYEIIRLKKNYNIKL